MKDVMVYKVSYDNWPIIARDLELMDTILYWYQREVRR